MSVPPAYIRHSIRQRFERTRNVTDLRAIDVLLLKERQEFQETVNGWKQTDHVVGILLQSQDRPHKTFLQKFYEGEYTFFYIMWLVICLKLGRDEEAALPAASGV